MYRWEARKHCYNDWSCRRQANHETNHIDRERLLKMALHVHNLRPVKLTISEVFK